MRVWRCWQKDGRRKAIREQQHGVRPGTRTNQFNYYLGCRCTTAANHASRISALYSSQQPGPCFITPERWQIGMQELADRRAEVDGLPIEDQLDADQLRSDQISLVGAPDWIGEVYVRRELSLFTGLSRCLLSPSPSYIILSRLRLSSRSIIITHLQ